LFLNSVIPTRRLIEASLAADVRRFVLVSSFGVYGAAELKSGSLVDESTPVDRTPHRRDPYSYSKVVQEQVAWEACRQGGLPLVVVRPGVIIGPGRGALSSRIGLQLGPLLIRMGGGQTLPYVFVDNCSAAIRQAGLIEGIDGEAFNVLDDELPTGKQILRMYRQAGHRQRSLWIPRPCIQPLAGLYEWYHRFSRGQLPAVITRYKTASMWKSLRFTNQKAKSRLRWSPNVRFEEAFRRSLGDEDA
jgi:nucleoside-diphosphate-sugar epimerase